LAFVIFVAFDDFFVGDYGAALFALLAVTDGTETIGVNSLVSF
jgi:hypothetical protein